MRRADPPVLDCDTPTKRSEKPRSWSGPIDWHAAHKAQCFISAPPERGQMWGRSEWPLSLFVQKLLIVWITAVKQRHMRGGHTNRRSCVRMCQKKQRLGRQTVKIVVRTMPVAIQSGDERIVLNRENVNECLLFFTETAKFLRARLRM